MTTTTPNPNDCHCAARGFNVHASDCAYAEAYRAETLRLRAEINSEPPTAAERASRRLRSSKAVR